MSPAIFYRTENQLGQGWRNQYGLDCFTMPGASSDTALRLSWLDAGKSHSHYVFGWTAHSYNEWVSYEDREELDRAGFKLKAFLCFPGTFLIGNEQVVFDRGEAILLSEEPHVKVLI